MTHSEEAGTNKQDPREIDIKLSKTFFSELESWIKNNDFQGFINRFKHQYDDKDLTDRDIMSISMIEAMQKYDIVLPGKILGLAYKSQALNANLFVTFVNNNNVISTALETGIGIQQLSAYICALIKRGLVRENFNMTDDLIKKIAYSITHPVTDLHPTIIIEKLIEPLYTKDAVGRLIEVIGKDWLDNYYT